jgi:hypothetical protein
MENHDNLNNLKDKLKKLMEKAESVKQIGNLEEANAFASKVNDLLLKYNLSKKEIVDHEQEPEVDGVDSDMEVRKAHGDWMAHLLNTLCEYNYCHPIFTCRKIDKEYKITIVGAHENVEVVSYLYDVLKNRFQDIAKKQFSERIKTWQKANSHSLSHLLNLNVAREDIKENKDGSCTIKKPWKYVKSFPNRGKFFKSFYLGALVGIRQKMKEDKERGQKSEMASQINALIKVNDNAIEKYMAKHYPNIKTSSSRKKTVDGAAYANGIAAGKGTSMAKGLANGDTISTKHLN